LQGAGKPLIYKGSWIERLNSAGVSVAGFDMQGCGFSEGLRGLRSFFESFEDVIADAVQFRRCAADRVMNCHVGRGVSCGVTAAKYAASCCVQAHTGVWLARL
jgi:alpha-beta hydrolase superfamily lysophospholipase